MVNTKQLFLTVLETGLTLIAVNLPSLWCHFTKIRPGSIFQSIRSMLSVYLSHSATSSPQAGSQFALSRQNQTRKVSDSSDAHFANLDAHSLDIYAMHDLEDADMEAQFLSGKAQAKDGTT